MTCWCCGMWLRLNDEDQAPEFCPACGEATWREGCGDDECAMHDDHCLLEEPRYRPDDCRFCREAS